MARPIQIVSISLCALLVVGAVWLQAAKPKFEGVETNTVNLRETPRHPVTKQMEVNAASFIGKETPSFELKDTENKIWKNADLLGKGKPAVLVMTKDGCPCSIESQPNWTKMSKHYGEGAQFFAIMDASPQEAKKFKTDFDVSYLFLSSPDDKAFRAFGAKQSVYIYLIGGDGKVVDVWPGYSKEMVKSLNRQLSELTGREMWVDALDMVPEEMTSGCFFFKPVGTEEPAW